MIGTAVSFASILVMVFICGYMSVGEASIASVSEAKARAWGEENQGFAQLVEWELNDRQFVVIAILVTHNLFAVASSSLMTVVSTGLWGSAGVFWATVVMTLMMVLFADFLPKCIGMALAERTFPALLPGLKFSAIVFKPVILLLDRLVLFVSRLFRVDMTLESSMVTRDEIEQLVKNGEESGAIEASERRMIDGVIAFDETRISEIMVPRVSMDALEVTQTIGDVSDQIQKWEHSRIPLYHATPDDIVGVIYLKDMIPFLREKKLDTPLEEVMRQPMFVPETMKVNDLFNTMRSERVHFAVVVDEYGGTAGIITLEDLLEEIVGEIRDEYDEETAPFIRLSPTSYKVRCSEPLEDLGTTIGYEFDCDEVDSVGGYVLDLFKGFPKKGDTLTDGIWTITVTDVGEHRVNEVIFTRNAAPEENGTSQENREE